MSDFVLVPGARLGGWAWDEVAAVLRAAGHDVYAVTLSGLGEEERDEAAEVGQQQHVDDILAVIEGNDLDDVVLVGHSYSGMPVGQAAARIGDRLRRVVYVDSNIATDGKAFIDGWSDEGRAWLEEQLAAAGGVWAPADADYYADQDLSDEAIAMIVARSTPHPGRTLTEPARLAVPLGDLPSTYIKCVLDGDTPSPDIVEQLKSPRWELVELPTGHWPMFSQPAALAKILGEVT